MKIGILSFKPIDKKASPEELRLKKEAIKAGHKARILRADKCTMYFNHQLKARYNGKEDLSTYDIIIPRVSLNCRAPIEAAIVEQIQLLNVPSLNTYSSITRAKNKLQSLQILNHYDIPVVKTVVIKNEAYLEKTLAYVKTPLIIKSAHGSYGRGIIIAETKRAAKAAYSILAAKTVLIQEYIKESKGKDIRVFVIGNRVIASMERAARRGEFRSNIELGGTGKAIKVNREYKNLAIRAAKALDLEVAGVDIIATKNGPAVMEVNANPGFKEIEEVSGVNIAEKIIKHAIKYTQQFISRYDI